MTANRQQRRAVERKSKNGATAEQELPTHYVLDLTPDEMGFLRLLLTRASVGPAQLKTLCGALQGKVEAQIGPLPPQ